MGWSRGENGRVHRVVTGSPDDRRPVGRPRRRWADNVKRDLAEIGCCNSDWVVNAQDRVAWRGFVVAAMNFRVPDATE